MSRRTSAAELRALGLLAPKGTRLRYWALAVATLPGGREVYATGEGARERWPLNDAVRHGERSCEWVYFRTAAERDAYAAMRVPDGAERVEWGDLAALYLAPEIERYVEREERHERKGISI